MKTHEEKIAAIRQKCMDEIIQKAIEGGYGGGKLEKRSLGWCYPSSEDSHPGLIGYTLTDIGRMVLEVEFWQALGRACNWQDMHIPYHTGIDTGASTQIQIVISFHTINLQEGWEKAIEFLLKMIRIPKIHA